MNKAIKDLIGAVAPTLATALGGPLAGVATRAIAGKILGKPDAPLDEIDLTLATMSPADLVKLKELEAEFKVQLSDAGVKLARIDADDRKSARERQVKIKDRTPAVLGLSIIIGFFGLLAYLFTEGMPADGTEVILIMVGALATMTTQVTNFFFGSSSGSKAKDVMIADLKGKQS